MSGITYPITFINDVTIDTDDGGTRCWGLLSRSTGVTYHEHFATQFQGVIVVFENTCDQVFTYRIDGENAIYVDRAISMTRNTTLWRIVDINRAQEQF
jgi:hypothetical protein